MTSIVIAFQLATTLIMTITQLVAIYTTIAIWFFAIAMYNSLPFKYAPVSVCILVKYAFFGKKIRVQDLLVEHVMNRHLV
jgi:hypothetical protein